MTPIEWYSITISILSFILIIMYKSVVTDLSTLKTQIKMKEQYKADTDKFKGLSCYLCNSKHFEELQLTNSKRIWSDGKFVIIKTYFFMCLHCKERFKFDIEEYPINNKGEQSSST